MPWSSASKRLRIRIESNYIDVGIKLFDNCGQRASSTADVKNAVTRPDGCLIDECSPCPIAAKEFHE